MRAYQRPPQCQGGHGSMGRWVMGPGSVTNDPRGQVGVGPKAPTSFMLFVIYNYNPSLLLRFVYPDFRLF